MTGYQMKRKIAAALLAAMMSGCMPFGALAEAIVPDALQADGAAAVAIAPQYTKIRASAEVSGTSITVYASGMSNPVIRAVLDGSDSRNMNGTKYTFEGVAPGEHTVQVRYNAPDTGDYASDVITVTIEAPHAEEKTEAQAEAAPVAPPVGTVMMESVQQVQPPKEESRQPEGKYEAVLENLIASIAPADTVVIGNEQQTQPPKAQAQQETQIEEVPQDLIAPAQDEEDEPVYSEIDAIVKTGADSITVTIVEASGEPMYIAVGEEWKDGLYKGDSATFDGLAAGDYDVEVDYEAGSNVFRTTATIEAQQGNPPSSDGSSNTGDGSGAAEPVIPPVLGDSESDAADGVKAFTVLPVVIQATVSVVIDGASDREIEISLLDQEGKRVASSAIIGSGLVKLGEFANGAYTVRAQYVTPVQNADGSYDFKTVTAQAVVKNGGDVQNEQAAPVDIQAKIETGKDYIIITVTQAADREMLVSVEGLGDKKIYKGNSVRYEGLTPGESYAVEIDYVDYIEGAKKFSGNVTIPMPGVLAGIVIGEVKAGGNVLAVKGTAQANEQIIVQAEPEGAKAEVLQVKADGTFETYLIANPGKYTKVSAYYVTNASTLVSKQGEWTVKAPAAAPSIAIDPVDIDSRTVVAKTGANLSVTLKTPDSTLTAESDADGVVRFSLPHTYLKGDVFTLTVVYDPNSGKSVSQKVTVAGIGNYDDLEYGDYGDEVLRLTTRLAELGYPVSPTRRYGSTVREAVKLFQAANGQEADGEAGDRMQAALYSVGAIAYGSGVYPTLVRGDKGLSLIYKLQQRLKDLGYYTIKVDGVFGSGTQRAVREFQRMNGLSVTGVADNATQTLLYSSAAKPSGSVIVSGDYDTLSRSGKYKSAVVPLQRRLKALGYYSGNIDGYFGSQTYRAVRNFQSRNGLTVTGVADSYTQQVLYSASAKSYSGSTSSSSSSTGYRLLYWGCRGDAVKRLQQALINAGYKSIVRTADGVFGQWTYDAVRAYQKDKGLAVDGIAGKNTQNALYGTSY